MAAEISSTALKLRQLNVASQPPKEAPPTRQQTRPQYSDDPDICPLCTTAHNLSAGTCFLWPKGSAVRRVVMVPGAWTFEDDVVRT